MELLAVSNRDSETQAPSHLLGSGHPASHVRDMCDSCTYTHTHSLICVHPCSRSHEPNLPRNTDIQVSKPHI